MYQSDRIGNLYMCTIHQGDSVSNDGAQAAYHMGNAWLAIGVSIERKIERSLHGTTALLAYGDLSGHNPILSDQCVEQGDQRTVRGGHRQRVHLDRLDPAQRGRLQRARDAAPLARHV